MKPEPEKIMWRHEDLESYSEDDCHETPEQALEAFLRDDLNTERDQYEPRFGTSIEQMVERTHEIHGYVKRDVTCQEDIDALSRQALDDYEWIDRLSVGDTYFDHVRTVRLTAKLGLTIEKASKS